MIANPLVDDAAVCKDCHLEDTPQYVERFAAIAGVHPIHPCPTFVAPVIAGGASGELSPPAFLEVDTFQPWQKVGSGILAIAFLGPIFFGYRCWKADCLTKITNS